MTHIPQILLYQCEHAIRACKAKTNKTPTMLWLRESAAAMMMAHNCKPEEVDVGFEEPAWFWGMVMGVSLMSRRIKFVEAQIVDRQRLPPSMPCLCMPPNEAPCPDCGAGV